MRLGKYVLLSFLLLALVACSTTHEGNLDAFLQKYPQYPQFKDEIVKLDPDFKSRVVVPLKYLSTVSKIQVDAKTNVSYKKSITLELMTFPKDTSGMVLIHIRDLKGSKTQFGDTKNTQDLKLNHGVTAKYKDNGNGIKWMSWYDDQNKLLYELTGQNITKDQLVQIANEIIEE